MLSKSHLKLITSLRLGKFRHEESLFIVEGVKMVKELLHSNFEIKAIFATNEWISGGHLPPKRYTVEIFEISQAELEKISNLSTPNQVLALAFIRPNESLKCFKNEWILALDQIRDPGNMGTILRTADWFGFKRIVAAHGTVDLWNPKVVQASMGSVFRIPVHYTDLAEFLAKVCNTAIIYGAFMEGDPVSETNFTDSGVMVIGNESHGISSTIAGLIHKKVTILPATTDFNVRAESLNASLATAILCYEIQKQSKA